MSTGLTTGLAVTGVIGAGCSSDIGTAPSADPADPSSAGGDDADADTAEDVDQSLVDDLVAQISMVHALVRETRRSQSGLARRLRPLADLHTAHAEVLGGPVSLDGLPSVPGRQRAALSAVLSAESDLRRRLVRGSVEARSGALALLLASMSAGLAQHLAGIGGSSP